MTVSDFQRVLTVSVKEIKDNLRDRQTVFYALLFGPLLMPLLIAGSLIGSMKQLTINFDQVTELPVINHASAPNLVQFLRSHNIDVVDAPEDYRTQLRDGDIQLVLEIKENYAENLRRALPAPLTLYLNESDRDSSRAARRINALLSRYGQTLTQLRMQVRGLDPTVFSSVAITETDISAEGASGQILASLLPFLYIISMVMGGFYLAIDTTAGERERLSLEPLLSLPIQRWQLLLGKYLATLLFVGMSLVLTALAIFLLFRFFPSETLDSLLRFDGLAIGHALLLASPLAFFITGLLITVATLTRSTKEAQTWLGLLMVIPMAPFFILQFVSIKSAAVIMAIPMLSQYKLLEKVARNDPIDSLHVVLSVGGTLVGALLLLLVAMRLYQQDRMLR